MNVHYKRQLVETASLLNNNGIFKMQKSPESGAVRAEALGQVGYPGGCICMLGDTVLESLSLQKYQLEEKKAYFIVISSLQLCSDQWKSPRAKSFPSITSSESRSSVWSSMTPMHILCWTRPCLGPLQLQNQITDSLQCDLVLEIAALHPLPQNIPWRIKDLGKQQESCHPFQIVYY